MMLVGVLYVVIDGKVYALVHYLPHPTNYHSIANSFADGYVPEMPLRPDL